MIPEIDNYVALQLSKHTQESYSRVLQKFAAWCQGKLPEGNKWVRSYTDFLKQQGVKNNTVNHHLTIVAGFYKYVTGKRLYYDRLKENRKEIEVLSEEDINKLLDNANEYFRPVIHFMLDSGVRAGELAYISRQKFDSIPDHFVITGKGNKQRVIAITDKTKAMLKNGLLFGREWTERGAAYQLERAGRRARLGKKVHPHILRHTFATNMLNSGVDIMFVNKMLGHAYLATTQIYTHVSNQKLLEVWQKCHSR